jgi:hypothetical protein
MLEDANRAKIVITNYHAFKLRERIDPSKADDPCFRDVAKNSIPSKPRGRCCKE